MIDTHPSPLKRVRVGPRAAGARRRPWALQAALFVLALPLLWMGMLRSGGLRVEVGAWGDHAYLSGINAVEQSASESYRWTTGDAVLTLPNISGRYRALELRGHGWRPEGVAAPTVQLEADGRPLGSFTMPPQMRRYHILLPGDAVWPSTRLSIRSNVWSSEADPRPIGIALDWLQLGALGAAPPAPWQFGGHALLVALLLALPLVLRLPSGWAFACSLVAAGALLAGVAVEPLWAGAALWAWSGTLGLLLAATPLLRPRLQSALWPWLSPRQADVAWALLAGALLLRLFGAVHPLFDMHDLPYHTGWLDDVARGELYIFSTPSEFAGRQTFNPPAGYLLLEPLLLLLDPRLAVQVGVALLDAFGCLLLLLLARELGLGGRAGLLALALYVALPINTTMLWWGFATNALAQPIWLLVALLLMRLARNPSWRGAAVLAATVGASLLTHVGGLALVAATLGLTALLGAVRLPRPSRAPLLIAGGGALAFVALLYWSAVAPPVLASGAPREAFSLPELLAASQQAGPTRLWLLGRGMLLGFLPIPLALAPLGFARLLARQRRPLGWALIAAWALACLGFIGAYFGLGLVVRHLYFLAPLLCLAVALVLEPLWRRRGQLVVLALVLLVAWSGVALWVGGVLMRIKPSGVPLTQ